MANDILASIAALLVAYAVALALALDRIGGLPYGLRLVACFILIAPPAFLMGMITIGAGWFILQPGMGAGWAASLHTNPMQVRLLNILAHSVFAGGMYGAALLLAKA